MSASKLPALRSKRTLQLSIAGIVTLVSVAFYASPYWTIYRMRQAILHSDARTLTEHIDFPAFRSSVKAQLQAQLAQQSGVANPLVTSGAAFAGQYVDSIRL
jgi:hypothetical protein